MNLTQLTAKVLGLAARLDQFITGDSWHLLSLQNGWTNATQVSAQYRATRDGGVWIIANIIPGTLTDGTAVFTLPVGFRPNKQVCFNIAVQGSGMSFSASIPHAFLAVNTTGVCNINGCNLGGTVGFVHIDGIVPLDTLL